MDTRENSLSERWKRMDPSRRRFLKLALAAGGVAAAGLVGGRLLLGGGEEAPASEPTQSLFLSRTEADRFLRPTDIVFGLVHNGEVRAYPQRVLVWHEIANDVVGGEEISITYCPLTGSQIAFRSPPSDLRTPLSAEALDRFKQNRQSGGPPKDGIPAIDIDSRTFGTTGQLVNSNLHMYDRETDSEWPQILGTAIHGSRRGQVLEEVPLVWTTWERWRTKHPDTVVLGTNTGYVRDYNHDPYGSYNPEPGGYYASNSPFFPVMHEDDRFHPKKVVFGLKVNGQRLAIPLEEFRAAEVRNFSLGDRALVALYDEGLDTIRVFRRDVEGETLAFVQTDGTIQDLETQTTWSPEGRGVDGPFAGTQLAQVNAFNVMWFAWVAFYPDTAVLGV